MMSRIRCAAVVLMSAVIWPPVAWSAPAEPLWSDGRWSVMAPPAGYCAPVSMLVVRGGRGETGSIFDPANATALAALESAVSTAFSRDCPETREVLILSGRVRRVLKLTSSTAPATTAPTSAVATPPAAAATAQSGNSKKSLAAAGNDEDKCEILFAWLESSKADQPPAQSARYRMAARSAAGVDPVLRIFRDEPMQTVFGTPYDKTENRWRLDLHRESIAPCLGMQPQRGIAVFRPRIPSRTMQQYWSQFQQYRQILDQAFLGQPGAYEPMAINRYLQQVRSQSAWVSQAMSAAAAAPPVRESFDNLTAQRQQLRSQTSMLGESERLQLESLLSKRQAEIAQVIAGVWLKDAAGKTEKSSAGARALHGSYSAIAPVVASLDASARASWSEQYNALMASLLAAPLQAETARLATFPASIAGAKQLASWKAGFDGGYRDLRSVPAVAAAAAEYQQTRARVLGGALPAWLKSVAAIPEEAGAIVAKQRELDTFFPAPEDRASPLFKQFESPLRAREDQLRIRTAAAAAAAAPMPPEPAVPRPPQQPQQQQQQQQQQPARSAAATTGPLSMAAFNAKGLTNERILMAIYSGDFAQIDFDREDLRFASLFEQYLRAYGRQCHAFLPANKVEIMNQECSTERVTKNGYGVETGRTCVNWVLVGSGLFADPILYDASKTATRLSQGDSLRHLGRMLTGGANKSDPLAGTMQLASDAIAGKRDMGALVQMNACDAPGLRRFEDNLKQFALNRPAVKLNGSPAGPSPALTAVPGLPYRDHNYARLMEDLVAVHAKTWAMNRYVPGSISAVSVSARDKGGRPAKIAATYMFNGFRGRSNGSVTLDLVDGLPECMYFFDYPASCRTPNRKIVAAYAEGAYQQ